MKKLKSFEVSLFKCGSLRKVPGIGKTIEASDVDTARQLGQSQLKPGVNEFVTATRI